MTTKVQQNLSNVAPSIPGKTFSYSDFFGDNANKIQKLVDFYEGDQLNHVVQMLNGGNNGWGRRKEWGNRGIIPRVRNITKSIIEKSGLLFTKPPQLGIVTNEAQSPVTDEVLMEMLENADWIETFQNVDIYTRLTGSVILMQQLMVPDDTSTVNGQYRFNYTRGDQLMLSILHHGNSLVRMNAACTKIIELAFIMNDLALGSQTAGLQRTKNWKYCVWTPTEILEIAVDEDMKVSNSGGTECEMVISREPNPYGMVPASFFYDTRKPRVGYWARPAEDLLSLQEIVNLALTDTEFAIAWQKQKTLMITGDFEADENNQGDLVVPTVKQGFTPGGAVYNDIPFYQTRKQTALGGLGSIVKLGMDGAGVAGKAEFIGPDTNLGQLDAIVTDLVNSVANDWSVNLNYGGKANSGFQLIVEEIDNLQLRGLRALNCQASLRRFYEVTKSIYPGVLTDGYLQAEFAPPNLPVNAIEQENVWTIKIDNNRASIKDYFMVEEGMTEDEAMAKMQEVLAMNKLMNVAQPPAPPVLTPPPIPTAGQASDGVPNA
jgi:hypothetical protein